MNPNTTFVGIDPGFSGGLGFLFPNGNVDAMDMPVCKKGTGDGYNALDLKALIEQIECRFSTQVHVKWGLENPTTRPGEGAERSFRFGKQIGNLEAIILALRGDLTLIPPATWTAKLGFPGKQYDNALEIRAAWLLERHPDARPLIYGPRGGILDGRLDALCIACYLKQISGVLGKFGGRRPPKFMGGGFEVV